MDTQRVTLITLTVTDLTRSKAFYKRLGWTQEAGGNDKIAFYRLHGQFLSLYDRNALVADIGLPIKERATGAITLSTNYSTQEAVDAAYQAAVDAGALQLTVPAKTEWGGYSGNYTDPDGHLWEVAHNPFWDLDASGQV